jgi:hypothetical protein
MVNPKTGKILGADEETDDPLRDVKPRSAIPKALGPNKEQRLVS